MKQYRPHRRPIVCEPGTKLSEKAKLKRKLVVRDWFFYVVWYVRLKKILKNLYSSGLLDHELESNQRYADIMRLMNDKHATIYDVVKKLEAQA